MRPKDMFISKNVLALNAHQIDTDRKIEEVFRRLDDNSEKPEKGIFYDGQIFDAYSFINERIREAKKRIVLIDNYVEGIDNGVAGDEDLTEGVLCLEVGL